LSRSMALGSSFVSTKQGTVCRSATFAESGGCDARRDRRG
jgi:hypothetical protein